MKYILIITFFLSFIKVHGQTNEKNPIDIELQVCLESEENFTTAGMTECVSKAIESWDKELNKNYQGLLNLLTSEQKEKLKESQRQWIKFRDSEIVFSNQFYSDMLGTMWIVVASQKQLDLTKQRALELSEYITSLTIDK